MNWHQTQTLLGHLLAAAFATTPTGATIPLGFRCLPILAGTPTTVTRLFTSDMFTPSLALPRGHWRMLAACWKAVRQAARRIGGMATRSHRCSPRRSEARLQEPSETGRRMVAGRQSD